jgi:uncharacterized membrane protein YfcA
MAALWGGFFAGMLSGLVGVGGGVVLIPVMTEILKFRQQEAHGTSLAAIVFTALAGSFVYYLHGSADIPTAALLAATALCTVRLGAKCCCALPEWRLKRYFGGFLLFIVLLLLMKPWLPPGFEGATPVFFRLGILAVVGVLTGFISGMMGVGGGMIMVPALVLFAGSSQVAAQGISLLSMIPISMMGAWTHWRMGHARLDFLPGLVAGALGGVYAGGSLAHLMPETELRLVFTALIIFMAVRYLRTKPKPDETCVLK